MNKIDKEELHNIFCEIKNNNEFYFNKLYEKYRKLIYAIAFSILKNKENSEDIVQRVYIKIWKMGKQKLPTNNESYWLYTLTKNETLDFLKYEKKFTNIDELYYISEENKELNEILNIDSYNRIIEKLDIDEQEIVSLKILSNLSFKEISQILNIPEGTIKWKYYKSVHALKLLLGNLSMFIVTFVIGLKTILSNQTKTSQIEERQEDESIKDSTSTSIEQSKQDELDNYIEENEIHETIIQNENTINNNCIIGILSISGVFLIFTIIFTIIFAKYQLKMKHKSSK